MQTHDVLNQATPLVDYDMFGGDPVLVELVKRYGAGWATDRLTNFGRFTGSAQAQEWAVQANNNSPVLQTHDRFGNRIDLVEFHPAYHELMRASMAAGVHNLPWRNECDGAHVARAALMFMAFQNEGGHCCPMSMTYAVVPSLRKQPGLAEVWVPRIQSTTYDSRFIPAAQKNGITMGMGMTEKQGGSDVRANTTRAVPLSKPGPGQPYHITGHKWFTSAPMSDAFLVLAKVEKGVSCFLVPRFLPDGRKNNLFIQRLKDKLGNRSNASSELEFENTFGWLVGEEGRGVATIIEMVNHTRLDCIIGSTALMRQATLQAIHHCRQRSAFGKKLVDQPLMQNVLTDLALESEAATRMMLRVAHAYDKPEQAHFKRIASAVTKYWACKRGPMHVVEALECFGGNGYVNAGPMPRLYTEAPLLGIWEGSGNVICLDILRAVSKEPETLDALLAVIEPGKSHSRVLSRHIGSLKRELGVLRKNALVAEPAIVAEREFGARRLAENLAMALQATLMAEQSTTAAADAFVASRLGTTRARAFGTLPAKVGSEIVEAFMAR